MKLPQSVGGRNAASRRSSPLFRGKTSRFFASVAAVAAAALLAPVCALASYNPAYSFTGGSDGNYPYAPLTVMGAATPQTATLWGTNTQHGALGFGAMFHYSPSLGTFGTAAWFNANVTSPSSQLVPVTFNSIAYQGGGGTHPRFAIRPATRFGQGVRSDNVPQTTYTDYFGTSLGPNGLGTVYRYHPGNSVIQLVHAFTGGTDGYYPKGGLVLLNGWLWGVSNGGGQYGYGVIFKINPSTNQLFPVYQFTGGSDGAYPNHLILLNGWLYGATDLGGTNNSGTIFSFDPNAGAHYVVCGDLSAMYGITSQLVPYAPPFGSAPKLYFSTSSNVAHGTLSYCNIKAKTTWVSYTFTGGDDGDHPYGLLSLQGNILYGATVKGGAINHLGNVYSFNLQTSAETPIHEFVPGEGGSPATGVVYFAGSLWGVTGTGGTSNVGTIFSTGLFPSGVRFHVNH